MEIRLEAERDPVERGVILASPLPVPQSTWRTNVAADKIDDRELPIG